MKFLIRFSSNLPTFHLDELDALAQLFNVKISYDRASILNDRESPYMYCDIPSIQDAKNIVSRAILIKYIILPFETATSLVEILEKVKRVPMDEYLHSSFKFLFLSHNHSIPDKQQREIVEKFSFMGLQGPVDLKNPQVTFVYAEDYRLPHNSTVGGNSQLIQNWFGRLIGHGNRAAINRFDLKQREYIGNTSMDPELSLIMSNMALCTKGSLVLDPFCGTGSFLLTCSHFGAFSMGTDIDGRQIRGKSSLEHEMKKLVLAAEVSGGGDGGNDDSAREKTNPDEAFVDDNNTAIPVSNYHQSARENTTAVSTSASPAYNNLMVGSRVVVDVQVKEWTKSSKKPKSAREINSQKAFKLKLYKDIESNIKQYGLKNRVLDTVVCDSANHPWCNRQIWDAIVSDPPYGVRAGLKTIGRKQGIADSNVRSKLDKHGAPRIPSTIDYDMTKAVIDLIEFAAIHLVPGGRLVFWLPTVTEEYTDLDIPAHPDLFLVASCEQSFGKWARRLITMEKRQRRQRVPGEDCNSDAAAPSAAVAGKQHIPAHANFRQVYFSSKNSSK